MKIRQSWLRLLAVTAGSAMFSLATVLPTKAYNVWDGGKSIGLQHGDIRQLDTGYWDLSASDVSGLSTDLSATFDINVLTFNSDTLKFDFNVNNTTSTNFESAIMSVFFDVSSDLHNIRVRKSDTFTEAELDDRAGRGIGKVDVCIFNSRGCAGGLIGQGLQSGSSDLFRVILKGDFSSGATTLTAISSNWKTEDGKYTVVGVPEPFTMIGTIGALGVGTLLKRRSDRLAADSENGNDDA